MANDTETPYGDLRLIILMRTDVPTMNAGKAVAQGSHAANQFVFEAETLISEKVPLDPKVVRLEERLRAWQSMTPQGFGTVIVLGVTEAQLRVRTRMAKDSGHLSGITHDPTYPTMMPRSDMLHDPSIWILFGLAVLMMIVGNMWVALAMAFIPWVLIAMELGRVHRGPPLIPLDTCGYIFGQKDEVADCVAGLELMR